MTLDERLRSAAQEVTDRFDPLKPSQLPHPATRRPRSRVRSGPAAAVAVFLAVLAVGAAWVWLGPFGADNPDVASPEVSRPEMTAVPPDFVDGWVQSSPLESGLTEAQLERIFALGELLIGIGTDPESGFGTVWTSDDGLHWEHVGEVYTDTGNSIVPSQPFPQLRWNTVEVGGPGLVAVDKPGSAGAEVWVGELSESDLTWKKTASLSGACCFIDIAASGDLIVVVSEQVDHQEGNPGVWTSTDAYTWERVPPEALPFGEATHGLGFVEAAGPGFVGTGFGVRSIYVSMNGTEWFSPQDFAETHPQAVRESLITLGHSSYGRLCLGEDDGRWVCGVGTNTTITSVATVGGRSVAVNSGQFDPLTEEEVPGGLPLLGLSTDQTTWIWIPPTPDIDIPSNPIEVVAWQGQIIVLTSDTVGGTVWVWTPQPG